jgi:hypothetical protein
MNTKEHANWHVVTTISKYREDIEPFKALGLEHVFYQHCKPYEVIRKPKNCLLNSGIDELWHLVTGDSANHFSNAKALIGVGDSATAAVATQTDLQAATNKDYHAMETGFPTHTAQAITFKASFGAGHAEYVWAEWVVKQGDSAVCLNRKVDALGTKSSGTWTLEVTITLS